MVVDVAKIVTVVEDSMDGTSGALFAIFLNALVHSLRSAEAGDMTPKKWATALQQSCEVLSKYTPAQLGDRTLVDSLYPFVETLEKTGDLAKAAEAAKQGALKTRGMHAVLGRAVYVGESRYDEVPDPGACGLAVFFLGLAGIELSDDDGWEAI